MESSIKFCGINFDSLDHKQIFNESDDVKFVVTVNSEYIVRANSDREFLDLINSNHATFDGQIPYIFAKLVSSVRPLKKISGSDLIYDACEYAKENNKSVFLLGGDSESNRLSVIKLREKYGIKIEGYSPAFSPYPFPKEHNDLILDKVGAFSPDYLFVSFGTIKQEYWIRDNMAFLKQHAVKLAVGCGGTFDFVAGKTKRAPRFIQKAGLEGIWRLLAEPKLFRMKRLLVSTKFFSVFYNHHISKSQPRSL
jgi:N-acetylglucosaminyldiphosphoundecaprenol N-acetyl-beta-D-mannosaminyltransferase